MPSRIIYRLNCQLAVDRIFSIFTFSDSGLPDFFSSDFLKIVFFSFTIPLLVFLSRHFDNL